MILLMLYSIYYLLVPSALIIASWKLWNDIGYSDIMKSVWIKESTREEQRKAKKNAYKTIVIFVIIILCLPLWGITASELAERQIRREVIGGTVFSPTIVDPVIHSLGPSYDTHEIIEEMEANPQRWQTEGIKERVDFDELTSVPGRLAVYRLRNRIILTYTYLAPFPIVRSFGFQYQEVEGPDGETELQFLVEREETYLFPFNPGSAGDIADF